MDDKLSIIEAAAEITTERAKLGDIAPGAFLSEMSQTVQMLIGLLNTEVVATNALRKDDCESPTPAVPIEDSVTDDYLICLEDGRKMKMLKRHLAARYGMTPDEYRAKWGLPPDYPMAARNFIAQKRAIAKLQGLGRDRRR